jgi:hypothetical protein
MKKISLFAGILLLTAGSCKKEDVAEQVAESTSTQTIDVSVESGSEYQYRLGSSAAAEISTQASHASVSRIAIVPSSSVSTYQYISDSTYTGTDTVVVVLPGEQGSGCHGSGSGKHGKKHMKFCFHIVKAPN